MYNNSTPYVDINKVLNLFLKGIKKILGENFIGMYVYGSLALGDFDYNSSDIDFIVITKKIVSNSQFSKLSEFHKNFDLTHSNWAKKIEAAYITQDAIGRYEIDSTLYPQIEKGKDLANEKLEMGWPFQCYTLREYGIVIEGPDPQELVEPVNKNNILQAAKSIANLWKEQAHDERESGWLIQREEQAFVVLTLCRFLYYTDQGIIGSKHSAAQWAIQNLEKKWHIIISKAITKHNQPSMVVEKDVKKTIEFIDYAAFALNK